MSWHEFKRRVWHNWRPLFCILVPIIFSPLAFTDTFVHSGEDEKDLFDGEDKKDTNKKFRALYAITIMAMFWMFEVIPLGVTSLFPIVFFPLLDVEDAASVSKNYMRESNMIFLGSIIISLAVEYCGVHVRLALRVISIFGTNPSRIMLGSMAITAFLSMWISATSCTSMLLPILSAITSTMFQEEQVEGIEETSSINMPNHITHSANIVLLRRSLERNHPNISRRRNRRKTTSPVLESASELSFVKEDVIIIKAGGKTEGDQGNPRPISNLDIIVEDIGINHEEDENATGVLKANKRITYIPSSTEASNSLTEDVNLQKNIRKMLLFAVAYSASIGGTGTLIGTGPIKVFKELAKRFHMEKNNKYIGITFATWSGFSLPVIVVNILIAWFFLILRYIGFKRFCTGHKTTSGEKKKVKEYLDDEYKKLGPITAHEIGVLLIFILVVLLWFFRDPQLFHGWDALLGIESGDSTAAMIGSILLFVIPRNWSFLKRGEYHPQVKYEALLDWKFVSTNTPWGYVLLIGSGYAIAEASEVSGLSHFIAEKLAMLSDNPKPVLLLIVMMITSLTTEIISSTACASLLLPIIFTLSCKISIHPLYLTIPSAISASYAFMLPISSPPNAIIFSTGDLEIWEMFINGLLLNIFCSVVLYIFVVTYGEMLFNFSAFAGVPCP